MKLHKSKNLLSSFKYAFSGVIAAFKQERNLKVHLLIMITVIILGIVFKINTLEWIICILLFGEVFIAELVNTAIESTVDIASPEIRPLAKQAKDIAAAAVLVSAVISVIVGIIIFFPKIFK